MGAAATVVEKHSYGSQAAVFAGTWGERSQTCLFTPPCASACSTCRRPSYDCCCFTITPCAPAAAESLKSNAFFTGFEHLCTVEKVGGVAVSKCGAETTSADKSAAAGAKDKNPQAGAHKATAKAKKAFAEATPGMKAECEENIAKAQAKLELQDEKDKKRFRWVVKEWSEVYPLCDEAFGFAANGRGRRRRGDNDMVVAWRLVNLLRYVSRLEHSNPRRQSEEMREAVKEIAEAVSDVIERAGNSDMGGSSTAPYVDGMRPGVEFAWPQECRLIKARIYRVQFPRLAAVCPEICALRTVVGCH